MESTVLNQSSSSGNSTMTKQRFDRFEAAEYLCVSVVTLDRALAQKKISCFRIGRRVVFGKSHLDEFLERNECKAKVTIRRGQI